ncbi:TetR/AcrR family transcriptional regulator [Labedaea rhizosphaerae]|uniref:TetR family transcriptional regulator n=1 Tax=Labedaea rhizosphaerae TaxID=598644 RepID=A0A4V6PVR5_LABRH|nr:TetR family transcriptional regulator [Labedaea rhizosphaerae]TDP95038.1 TetR family transcriptional regulator [Labedaea rhizosphaerae]
MATELGLRARKKQQTRRRIVAAAIELFADRGFDRVPVAEVARHAEVSEATVFNYFATKEDLVYDGMEEFERSLLDALRSRPAGTPVLAAFREFVLQPRGAIATGDPEAMAGIATVARITAESASLQARERQTFERYTAALAALLTEETGAGQEDLRPFVVANAMMGVNRAMKEFVQRQATAGRTGPQVGADTLAVGEQALELLERGLAGYPGDHVARPGK